MRFLHLADLHIGKQIGNYSLIEDQRFTLGRIVELMVERNVDTLVIAGDIYDKSAPSAEAVSLFNDFLTEVVDAGITVIAIPGNHDSAERLSFAQDILKRQKVYFPPVYDGTLMKVSVGDQWGEVDVWLMPFIKPAMVRKCFPDLELGNDYTAAVSAVLGACELDPTRRNVLVAHQFVTASGLATERALEELDLGGVDNVDASLFNAFDYVALGHVHRPQRVGRDVVRYAGSLLKYSVSEAMRPKSLVFVEVGEKVSDEAGACVTFELVDMPTLRDLRVIEGPLEMLTSPEVVGAANADDYVFARLTNEYPQIDAMAKLRAVYPHILGVEEQVGVGGGGIEDLEELDLDDFDPFEAFCTFFQRQTGKVMTKDQRTLAEAALRDAKEAHARGGRDAFDGVGEADEVGETDGVVAFDGASEADEVDEADGVAALDGVVAFEEVAAFGGVDEKGGGLR